MTSYKPVHVPMSFVYGLTIFHCITFLVSGYFLHLLLGGRVSPFLVFNSMYVCEILSLITHWLGHIRFETFPLNLWYKAHTLHHMEDYPASRFLSSKYEPAKKDNSKAYVVALLITPVFVCHWSVVEYLCSWGFAYAMLITADTLHMAIHVNEHPWEKYQWFRYIRALHYHHHAGDRKRNYAIG